MDAEYPSAPSGWAKEDRHDGPMYGRRYSSKVTAQVNHLGFYSVRYGQTTPVAGRASSLTEAFKKCDDAAQKLAKRDK
jgi:hypothetical protein